MACLQLRDIRKAEGHQVSLPEGVVLHGQQCKVAHVADAQHLCLPLFGVPRPPDIHCGAALHLQAPATLSHRAITVDLHWNGVIESKRPTTWALVMISRRTVSSMNAEPAVDRCGRICSHTKICTFVVNINREVARATAACLPRLSVVWDGLHNKHCMDKLSAGQETLANSMSSTVKTGNQCSPPLRTDLNALLPKPVTLTTCSCTGAGSLSLTRLATRLSSSGT